MTKLTHIIIAFLVLIAFSCKKEHASNNNPTGKLYTVTFNINGDGFARSIMKSDTLKVNDVTDPAEFKKHIGLLYVNMARNITEGGGYSPVSNVYDTKTMTTLNLTKQYVAGNYKIYILGGQYGLFDGSNGSAAFYQGDPRNYPTPYFTGHWKDSFYGTQAFTVKDNDLTVNLNLNRINAGIEVDITDALPQNVTRFTLEFSSDDYLSFNTWTSVLGPVTAPNDRKTFSVTCPIVCGVSLILRSSTFH